MVDGHDDAIVASTPRLLLRAWRAEELERFYDMHRREEVARWIGVPPLRERNEAAALIERNAQRLSADPRFGAWAIVERASGIPAGTVLLKPIVETDADGEIEIGWHLHPDRWGHGLATEAAAAILARGFAEGLQEIWALTHLDNTRSAQVCERIGMRLLGVTHRWYDEPSLMFWAGAQAGLVPTLKPDAAVQA
jgi:RimJ/RimL family protein N-acetyltransferase